MKTKKAVPYPKHTEDFNLVMDAIIHPYEVNYRRASVGFAQVVSIPGKPLLKQQKKVSASAKVLSFTPLDLVETVRSGIAFKEFYYFYKTLGFTTKKWAEILGVNVKTMQNILKEKKDLNSLKSEKFLQFALLVHYGIEVFGSLSSFKEWLYYKTPFLKNNAPVDLLDSIQGINVLHEQLFKIETGNLV